MFPDLALNSFMSDLKTGDMEMLDPNCFSQQNNFQSSFKLLFGVLINSDFTSKKLTYCDWPC